MQRDYCAFRQVELSDSLRSLDQAAIAIDEARDRLARQRAERQMMQAAQNAIAIEPHLAYLWYWAKREAAKERRADQEARRASEIANSIRDAWQKKLEGSAMSDAFRFIPDVSAIAQMPPLSFLIHIPFQLQKPYLSKDERDFYLLDNPLRRERVFQVPFVAATSWKGALRAALWQLGYKEEHEVTFRLLGNPRGSDEHQAGRLYFYPTFFDKIGLEVINPHSRKTGIGERGPILIECVPKGIGTLLLLYVPFGPIDQSEQGQRDNVAQDLEVLAEGVQAMLTAYGFGAKTSSGFGTAADQLTDEGKLDLRAKLTGEAAPPAASPEPEPAPDLPRYLESPGRLHADFCRPDGSLKSEAEYQALVESRGEKYAKRDRQLYDKAEGWWEREGRQLVNAAPQEPEPEAEPPSSETPPVTEWTFPTLSELRELARRVADQLRKGGEA